MLIKKEIFINIFILILIIWVGKVFHTFYDLSKISKNVDIAIKSVFIIVIIFLFFLLFKKNNKKKILITINFYCTFFLLIITNLIIYISNEYITKKKGKIFNQKRIIAASNLGITFDMRHPSDVADELSGKIVYAPVMFLKEFINNNNFKDSIFPLSGISKILTVDCNENGPFSVYLSDRYGFNNDDKIYNKKEKKIILIGDSMVQGNCVDQKHTISGHLYSKGYQAIGLGMSGNGPLIELAILKEYALKLNPSTIIWVYAENDIDDLERDLEIPALKKYIEQDYTQNIINRQNEVDLFWDLWSPKEINKKDEKNVLKKNLRKIERSFFLKSFKDRIFKFNKEYIQYDKVNRKNIDEFINIIQKVKNTSNKIGSNFYFVYLPFYETMVNKEPKNKEIILKKLQDIGVDYIDFFSELKELKDPISVYPFRLKGHFTKEGYKMIADKIEEKFLTSN